MNTEPIEPGTMEEQLPIPTETAQKASKRRAITTLVNGAGDVARDVSAAIEPDEVLVDSLPIPVHNGPQSITLARRVKLEAIVHRGLRAFYEAGCALRLIDEECLWADTHDSFQDYCKDTFGLEKNYRNKLIRASIAVDNLKSLAGTIVPAKAKTNLNTQLPLPFNEAQTRPLTKLETPEQQATAWHLALTLSDNKPTAKTVQDAVDRVLGKAKQTVLARIRKEPLEWEDLPEPFKTYSMQFGEELARIIEDGFADIPQSYLKKMCRTFLEGVTTG